MRRGGNGWIVLGVAVLAVLAPAAAAEAATTVSYTASAGVRVDGDSGPDDVTASRTGSVIKIQRGGPGRGLFVNTLARGAGCSGTSEEINCTIPPGGLAILTFVGNGDDDGLGATAYPDDIFADGRDGNDVLIGGAGFDSLEGGNGADRLVGNAGNDQLAGEDGNDSLRGDDGDDGHLGGAGADRLTDGPGSDSYGGGADNDDFVVDGASTEADTYTGGAGRDEISYAARTTPVTVRPGSPSSGFQGSATEPAEFDFVGADIEKVVGGSANDTLDYPASSTLDVVLAGGPGNDTLKSAASAILIGGTGRDTLTGSSGNDTLSSRDGEQDQLDCDGGADDFAFADLRDTIRLNCEGIDQGERREGPHVIFLTRTARVEDDGTVQVRLRCPRQVGRLGCSGRLAAGLELRRTRLGTSTRYRIRAGRRATVVVRLRPADHRAIGRTRRARLRLVSVERGRHGPKTTQRVVPVVISR